MKQLWRWCVLAPLLIRDTEVRDAKVEKVNLPTGSPTREVGNRLSPRWQEAVEVGGAEVMQRRCGRGSRERRCDELGRGAVGQKPVLATDAQLILGREFRLQAHKCSDSCFQDLLQLCLSKVTRPAVTGCGACECVHHHAYLQRDGSQNG